MEAKQTQINALHLKLRESSIILGQERSRLEAHREVVREAKERRLKITNLTRAVEEEQSRLTQINQRYARISTDDQLQLGDADKGLSVPAVSGNILSNINPNPHQPQVFDQAQQRLLQNLPPVHVLRARLSAYVTNNENMEQDVSDLQSRSMAASAKYRKIISLNAHVPEEDFDRLLPSLLRAVDSERPDVELSRVRDFLQRVGDE